jgi:REP element-mobilizing transposase RayT
MKPRKYEYRRNLPHILKGDRPHFVTFITHQRWELPPAARDLVLKHCMQDDGVKLKVHAVVVMPDHVHMILTPLQAAQPGAAVPHAYFSFEEILGAIKGASAHSINCLLGRQGTVWQDESCDHVLRSEESLTEKAEYVFQNPVRKGLVATPEDYRWLWKEGSPRIPANPNIVASGGWPGQ